MSDLLCPRANTQQSEPVRQATKGERRAHERGGGPGAGRAHVQRSLEDESFRQRLLENPKAAVEQELRTQLPEGARVRVVEESADTFYLVLPSTSPLAQGDELSERELEVVAGGGTWTDPTCASCDPCVRTI